MRADSRTRSAPFGRHNKADELPTNTHEREQAMTFTYTKTLKSVTLHDGTTISDVMGIDPDPSAADGKRWVGYTADGARRQWYASDIASVVDTEYDHQTSWVAECMDKQR